MRKLSNTNAAFALASLIAATSSFAAPQIIGPTIRWADDGWYQVQNAYDYTELCGGGRVCTVNPGLYIVTNHTTGERYENVVVRDLAGTPSPITVTGKTISWPDDGWYQIQRAEDYTSVCEGGRQCDVDYGVYIAINHTTGQRVQGILVNELPAGKIPAPVNTRLDEATPYLIESLAGYQLEQIQNYVAKLSNEIISNSISGTTLLPSTKQFTVLGQPRIVVNERTAYACSGGGSMVQEVATLSVRFPIYTQENSFDTWVFENCQIEITGIDDADSLPGEYAFNGELTNEKKSIAARNFSSSKRVVSYSGFTLNGPKASNLTIDASATVDDTGGPAGTIRNVEMEKYQETRNGILLRDIQDSNFKYELYTGPTRSVVDEKITMAGQITGSVTQGAEVSLTTGATLKRTIVLSLFLNPDNRVPFSGQIQLSSTDGSEMRITAKPYSNTAPQYFTDRSGRLPFEFDFTLLDSSGETLSGRSQRLPTFVANAPDYPFFPQPINNESSSMTMAMKQ